MLSSALLVIYIYGGGNHYLDYVYNCKDLMIVGKYSE